MAALLRGTEPEFAVLQDDTCLYFLNRIAIPSVRQLKSTGHKGGKDEEGVQFGHLSSLQPAGPRLKAKPLARSDIAEMSA
ncbi:hypothetical protein LMH87_004426 [Akanthomyces muscarius]|uniref:Uncharacterized protein n=1 Tax=Akanthomyces muscarius TaxID=2231603 RepID=A0A9W8Q423_AKAMU|nr:hypothetical protein LMH87_004426 [Akanthomyces muscarius]KAJ4145578.1 hypothetical protein LMH87_004426 [Akanthomyces muscarius]